MKKTLLSAALFAWALSSSSCNKKDNHPIESDKILGSWTSKYYADDKNGNNKIDPSEIEPDSYYPWRLDFAADGTVRDTDGDIVYHLNYSIQDRNLYLGDGQFYIKTLSDTELIIFDHFQEDGANMLEEIGFRRDK